MKYYLLFLLIMFSVGMLSLGIQKLWWMRYPPQVRKPAPCWLLVDSVSKTFAIIRDEVHAFILALLLPGVAAPYSEETLISLRLNGYRHYQD